MSLLTTCQNAADEVGIKRPTAVSGAVDDQSRRLHALAKRAAAHIMRFHPWAALVSAATIAGTGAAAYALESNYDRGIPSTEWDATNFRRLDGSVSQMRWQTSQNGWVSSGLLNRIFTVRGVSGVSQIHFDPALESGESITYDYIRNDMFSDGMGGFAAEWSDDSYESLLDEDLIEMSLIYRIKRVLGEDWQSDRVEFLDELKQRAAQDSPAPMIWLSNNEFVLPAVTPETIPSP